jgi:hypothetical protein
MGKRGQKFLDVSALPFLGLHPHAMADEFASGHPFFAAPFCDELVEVVIPTHASWL